MTKNSFYILLLVSALFTSCIPVKDLWYLQDKNTTGEQNTISAVESKPYRLQVNDVLSINIKAIDPKLVSIFNTTENTATGKSESALYFDGFTVDDHGNIRMPILGELNVIGYTLEEVRIKIEKKLLEEIDSKYIKSSFNFANAADNGRDIPSELKILGKKHLGQIHASNTDKVWLENDTMINMPEIKKTLDEMKWSGWLIVERSRDVTQVHNVKVNYGANVAYLKKIFQN